MKRSLQLTLGACALALAAQASAQVTFYEGEGFRGAAFTANQAVGDFTRHGYNDRASSVVVTRGRWEVCEDANYTGLCVRLRPGSYDSLRGMGLNNRVSSMRPLSDRRRDLVEVPPPMPAPDYAWRRRPNERVEYAPVTAVRAVVGPPEQRCWVEKERYVEPGRSEPNVGGAIIGGLSAASSATRSVAARARTSPPQAARLPASRSARTPAATAAPRASVTCSAARPWPTAARPPTGT